MFEAHRRPEPHAPLRRARSAGSTCPRTRRCACAGRGRPLLHRGAAGAAPAGSTPASWTRRAPRTSSASSPCCAPTSRATATRWRGCAGSDRSSCPRRSRERNVRLVDFDDLTNNVFHVTDEWRAAQSPLRQPRRRRLPDQRHPGGRLRDQERRQAGRHRPRRRPDPPLPPRDAGDAHRAAGVRGHQLLDFYYGATWSTSRKNLFNWKDEQPRRLRAGKVKPFFDRRRFLKVLRDYIIFLTKDDELTKVILRQHQTRAVEKVHRAGRATRRSAGASSGTPRAAARPSP